MDSPGLSATLANPLSTLGGSPEALAYWDIHASVWKPRAATSDSRSFWDTEAVIERAVQLDWARARSDRLAGVVCRLNKPSAEKLQEAREELEKMGKVVARHAALIYQARAEM